MMKVRLVEAIMVAAIVGVGSGFFQSGRSRDALVQDVHGERRWEIPNRYRFGGGGVVPVIPGDGDPGA